MKPITLEEIDKKKKNIAQSLDQLNLEKRKVERAEKEMLELHRQSLKPLRPSDHSSTIAPMPSTLTIRFS